MCTAVSFLSSDHYFGRNLDLEYSYQESVVITPRNYPLRFRNAKTPKTHYAMIGAGIVREDYPLYYDATNEYGLSMAGLNFPGNAVYDGVASYTAAPFELIPWVLSQCKNTEEALVLLKNTALAPIRFSSSLPVTDLHWMVSDKEKSITVEPEKGGLMIRENPVCVLTNNPPFSYHLHNLKNYMKLSENDPENTFAPQLDLQPCSRGMGALGMPGDLSSQSRFIRAAFTLWHSVRPPEEDAAVNQFFHILGAVCQQEGCVRAGDHFEKTVYSSCCNTNRGIYYYTTYDNRQIRAVHLMHEDLNSERIVAYPMQQHTSFQNIN